MPTRAGCDRPGEARGGHDAKPQPSTRYVQHVFLGIARRSREFDEADRDDVEAPKRETLATGSTVVSLLSMSRDPSLLASCVASHF